MKLTEIPIPSSFDDPDIDPETVIFEIKVLQPKADADDPSGTMPRMVLAQGTLDVPSLSAILTAVFSKIPKEVMALCIHNAIDAVYGGMSDDDENSNSMAVH